MKQTNTDLHSRSRLNPIQSESTPIRPGANPISSGAKAGRDFHRLRFDSIQALRGLAALLVVWEHVRFFGRGAFGVDIFFCISGFMIMFTTLHSSRHFLFKRLVRILPFYWMMTFATYGLLVIFPQMFEQTRANPVFLIKSLFFLPFDIGNGLIQPLYRIGWTLNCEMFFYLIFYIAMRINHKWRGLTAGLILSGIVILGQLLAPTGPARYFFSQPYMLEFVLGIGSYYLASSLYKFLSAHPAFCSRLPGYACLMLSMAVICLLVWYKPLTPIQSFGRLLYWGLPAALLFMGFFVSGCCISFPAPLVWIGNISFSIYLTHYYIILFADRKIWDFSHCSLASFAGAVISTLLVIGVSALSWLVIEKKLTRLLMKLVDNSPQL